MSRKFVLLASVLAMMPGLARAAPVNSRSGSMTAATSLLPAEPGTVVRQHLEVSNLGATGGVSLYCTADGTAPSAVNASFIVYAQGFYDVDAPSWVPPGPIICAPASGSVTYHAESYP